MHSRYVRLLCHRDAYFNRLQHSISKVANVTNLTYNVSLYSLFCTSGVVPTEATKCHHQHSSTSVTAGGYKNTQTGNQVLVLRPPTHTVHTRNANQAICPELDHREPPRYSVHQDHSLRLESLGMPWKLVRQVDQVTCHHDWQTEERYP